MLSSIYNVKQPCEIILDMDDNHEEIKQSNGWRRSGSQGCLLWGLVILC